MIFADVSQALNKSFDEEGLSITYLEHFSTNQHVEKVIMKVKPENNLMFDMDRDWKAVMEAAKSWDFWAIPFNQKEEKVKEMRVILFPTELFEKRAENFTLAFDCFLSNYWMIQEDKTLVYTFRRLVHAEKQFMQARRILLGYNDKWSWKRSSNSALHCIDRSDAIMKSVKTVVNGLDTVTDNERQGVKDIIDVY